MNSADKDKIWWFPASSALQIRFHNDFITHEDYFKQRFLCHYLTESFEVVITSE